MLLNIPFVARGRESSRTMETANQYEKLRTPCRFSSVYSLIADRFSGKKVLDIGCATGEYLSRFSKSSLGIDYSDPNLEICRRKGLNVIKADINAGLPISDESFDIAFCSHVLEHVDSPIMMLREMRRILKRDGCAVLIFPVERSLARIVLRDHYFKRHPTHLYSFSLDCIDRLLQVAGFKKERMLLGIPLIGRLESSFLLRMSQLFPVRIGLLISGDVWILANKV